MLFKEHPDFVWGLIASIWASNALGVLIVLAFVPLFVAVLRTPFEILMPTIVFLCAIGAFAVSNRMADMWYMLAFGVIGYALKKLEYPLAPLVLALVLGDLAESSFRQSLVMSQGSFGIFFSQPIAAALNGAAILLFAYPAVKAIRAWLRGPVAEPVAPLPAAEERPAA
jgi:putative tricarboxylic transport membrane protein